jgi:hypothetical protein
MISNLWLLFLAIAKTSLVCGFGPAIAIAILYECFGVRIVRVGVEKVSARQLAQEEAVNRTLATMPRGFSHELGRATSPPRKVRVA